MAVAGLESPSTPGKSIHRLAKATPGTTVPNSRFNYINSIVLRQENNQIFSNKENFYVMRLPLESNQLTSGVLLLLKSFPA